MNHRMSRLPSMTDKKLKRRPATDVRSRGSVEVRKVATKQWERRLLAVCSTHGPFGLAIVGKFMSMYRGCKEGNRVLDMEWCCVRLWRMGPGRPISPLLRIAGADKPPRFWRISLTRDGRTLLYET